MRLKLKQAEKFDETDRIRVNRMDRLDDWHQRISEGKIDGALQNEIADKILELLEQKKASLITREKILFARAIFGP